MTGDDCSFATPPTEGAPPPKRPRSLRAFMLTMLVVAVAIYGCLCIAVLVLQTRLLFPGGEMTSFTPSMPPFRRAYEDVYLDVGAEKTHAWYLPLENARGCVLYSHGNGGALSDWFEAAAPFRDLGFSVLMYDYGGYGTSTGRASEQRCYADIRAVWKFLTEERDVPPGKILLLGRSLGGGVAAQLATEVSPRAVILESTFSSVAQLAEEMFHIFPMRFLIWNRFNTLAKIGKIHVPLLIIHSPDDSLIPYHHARANYERANAPKEFLEIRGDHNEGTVVSAQLYEEGLARFAEENFPRPKK